jgi:hypothetical protein
MFVLDQPKVTANRTITYPLFWRQGVRISTNSPEYKTEFFVVALPRKMWKHFFVSGGFITHHPELIIQN